MSSSDEVAPFFGFMGATSALVFSCMGAAYGTAKSGVGIASMGVMRPELVMKSIVPVVMAGVLGIYGLIIAVVISTNIDASVVHAVPGIRASRLRVGVRPERTVGGDVHRDRGRRGRQGERATAEIVRRGDFDFDLRRGAGAVRHDRRDHSVVRRERGDVVGRSKARERASPIAKTVRVVATVEVESL